MPDLLAPVFFDISVKGSAEDIPVSSVLQAYFVIEIPAFINSRWYSNSSSLMLEKSIH